MLVKTAILALAASSLQLVSAAAYYAPRQSNAPSTSQCTITNGAQCCTQVVNANNPAAATLLGLLGVVVQGADVLVGLTCTTIGVGGSCNSNAVCCQNNSFNGLINVGCSPIAL